MCFCVSYTMSVNWSIFRGSEATVGVGIQHLQADSKHNKVREMHISLARGLLKLAFINISM